MIFSSMRVLRAPCLLVAVALTAGLVSAITIAAARKPKKLLVVTVTKGFRHQSIPTAEKVLQALGEQSRDFTVDYVHTDEEMATKMTPAALKEYDGVVFASTTGDLPLPDREGFLDWIRAGHAFIGIHAATDTFHNYPPYIEMINGEFKTHGPQVSVDCITEDAKHPATKGLPNPKTVFDEIYVLKNFDRNKVHMLLSLDKNPDKKDPNYNKPEYHPIAWTRMYGKGRVFYTALGHREDVLEADWYKQHLLGGIRWSLNQAKGDAKPQKR